MRATLVCLSWVLVAAVAMAAAAGQSAVTLRLLDQDGEDASIFQLSNPYPAVTLDHVQRSDVTVLDAQGTVRLRLSGTITDPLADVVPDHRADITEVTIEEQTFPVRRVSEPATLARPFAFRGRFTATVDVVTETLTVEAVNALGNKGFDMVDLKFDLSYHDAENLWTGNDSLGKFFDPFTVTLRDPPAGAPASIAFRAEKVLDAPAFEVTAAETAPGSRVFLREQTDLRGSGHLSFRIDEGPRAGGPAGRRVFTGTFDSYALSIIGEQDEFMETRAGSGVFRSAASRLPNNDLVELQLLPRESDLAPAAIEVRVGPWQAFAAEAAREQFGATPGELGRPRPPDRARLMETGAGSRIYTGSVDGLGAVALRVYRMDDQHAEIFLSSATLGLEDFLLTLIGNGRLYRTRAVGPERIEVTPASVSAHFVGVEDVTPRGVPLSQSFNPVWVVLDGVSSPGRDDYGEVDGRRFALTTSAAPFPGPARVRLALPLVFVAGPAPIDAPNVFTAVDRSSGQPAPKVFTLAAYLGGVRRAAMTAGAIIFVR
jgi:hypothetical protein